MINIEPTKDHPVPYSTDEEKPATFKDELTVTANTVDLLFELGASVEATKEEAEQTKRLVKAAITKQDSKALQQPNTAFAAAAFLKTYANQLALDVHQARSAITSKLMEIANCGDPKYELKALELLGKHSDIGLFTERSEITVNYKNSSDLEAAIKERVKRLLNAEVVDITPIGDNLDEELGVVDMGGTVEDKPDDAAGSRDTE
jgi:hypothetical protein